MFSSMESKSKTFLIWEIDVQKFCVQKISVTLFPLWSQRLLFFHHGVKVQLFSEKISVLSELEKLSLSRAPLPLISDLCTFFIFFCK